jgi:hypothetical protein
MSGDYRHQFSVEVLAWGLRFPYHIILKFHLVVSIGHGQSRRRRQGISPETAYETPEIRKYFSSLIIRLCTSARSSRWTTYRRRSQRCEQALCSTHGRACATVNKRQPVGLARLELICVVAVGSMSRDDRNDVLSSSFLVLVMVRNESRRPLCSGRGVPFKSKI